MKTSTKAALAGAALVVGAAVVSLKPGGERSARPMKYRAEEFRQPASRERDAGVLVRGESMCCRAEKNTPECKALLRRVPELCP